MFGGQGELNLATLFYPHLYEQDFSALRTVTMQSWPGRGSSLHQGPRASPQGAAGYLSGNRDKGSGLCSKEGAEELGLI